MLRNLPCEFPIKFRNPVHVNISEGTYGPRTRSFGIRFIVQLNDLDQIVFKCRFEGNNTRNSRNYKVALPPNFGTMTEQEQYNTLIGLLLKQGADLSMPLGTRNEDFVYEYNGCDEEGSLVF